MVLCCVWVDRVGGLVCGLVGWVVEVGWWVVVWCGVMGVVEVECSGL